MDRLPALASIAARLRFRQLQFLVALDELGSLHRVAERLGMTQPGATKLLRELETTFGSALFERSRQGMQPNEAGRCVIRYARLAQSELDQLRQELASVMGGQGGRLSVGAIGGALSAVLVPALADLRRREPRLSVSVREDTSAGLLAALADGRLDLALCRTRVAPQPALFEWEHLAEEPVALAVGPSHALAGRRRVRLQDLPPEGWVVYPAGMPLRTLLEQELDRQGLPLPVHAIETASILATVQLLQRDAGLAALLPADTVAAHERQGLLARLPVAIRSRPQPYGIATRRGWTPTPAARLLVEALRAAVNRDSALEPGAQPARHALRRSSPA